MTIKCRVCGIKITKCNKYIGISSKKRGRICKECDKYQRTVRRRRADEGKTFLLKRKYSLIAIRFVSRDERREFVAARQAQRIGCHPKSDSSSRVGQHVDHLVEVYDPDTRQTHRHYQPTLCDECGSSVRFDKNGFKTCVKCGLFSSNVTLDNETY
jgi:hypothetical protein